MRQLALYLPETLEYQWLAGSSVSGLPLGGHIHFGIRPRQDMMIALDTLLVPVAALIDVQAQMETRRIRGYGKLSDHRRKSHGFEYRALGSWLWSPGIALGILALAQAIVYDCSKKRLPWRRIMEVRRRGYIVTSSPGFDTINIEKARQEFPKIWAVISSLRSVHRFWPEISFLNELISRSRTWENGQDMKTRWRVVSSAGTGLRSTKEPRRRMPRLLHNRLLGIR